MAAATLCESCKLLKFDDEALGGSESCPSSNGGTHLVFDDNDQTRFFPIAYRFDDIFPELPNLAISASAGCPCCSSLRQALLSAGLQVPDAAETARVKLAASYVWKIPGEAMFRTGGLRAYHDRGLAALALLVEFLPSDSVDCPSQRGDPPMLIFHVDSEFERCRTWLRLMSTPRNEVLGTSNIRWIKQQHEAHKSLSAEWDSEEESGFLPTRLIDVGCERQRQPMRLVLSEELVSTEAVRDQQYAALSYCWGAPDDAKAQFKTERGSLADRLRGIDLDSMTAVVKDAIKVCRALDIRYLWVDAVCILQGDAIDWEKEAAMMSLVYSNAAVTLCPVTSSSCRQGFLSEEKPSQIDIPFKSGIRPDISGTFTLRHAKTSSMSGPLSDVGSISTADLNSVWETRAWTFQEYQLSRFILMFGAQRIHIVTSQGILTEGETEHIERGTPTAAFLDRCIAAGESLSDNYINAHWMSVVPDYCNRNLAYLGDRLPALSGLAAYFQGLLDDRYIAGLWQRDLFRQLFWTVDQKGYNRKKPGRLQDLVQLISSRIPFIAPSWSWLSQHGDLDFSHRYMHMKGAWGNYRPEYSGVEPTIVLSGTGINPMGKIDHASLKITSRLVQVERGPRPFRDEAFMDGLWQTYDENGAYVADCGLDWTADGSKPDRRLYLLLLGSCVEEMEGGPFGRDKRYAWGLVICETDSDHSQGKTYYRVGVFYSKPKGNAGLQLFQDGKRKTVYLI
ncbi:heterokaryon incompatibility protein-domain-containing protein [Xylariomycetidae sp. FL0641]|nr:heterokaryon incompatibility protein-domain-containing protein [Xylariomycetidae sp. FL0641]